MSDETPTTEPETPAPEETETDPSELAADGDAVVGGVDEE